MKKIVKSFSECEAAFGASKEYFIQINTGDELQKSGVMLSEAEQFISSCIENYKLNIIGLMCIPPIDSASSDYFKKMVDRRIDIVAFIVLLSITIGITITSYFGGTLVWEYGVGIKSAI